MTKSVISLYQNSYVSKAVEAMDENNVGSIVVLDSLGPCGIFTERDLLCKVLWRDRDPAATVLTEVLSPVLPAINFRETLVTGAEIMAKKRSRLMIFDGEDLVGILTTTDVVRAIASQNVDFSIDSVLTKHVLSAPSETPIDVIIDEMKERGIGSIIVSYGGGQVGIFTERDLVKRVVAPHRTLNTEVGRVASSPLITGEAESTGMEAAESMYWHGIKRLPLSVNGVVVRIVTARDVVEAFARSSQPFGASHVAWSQWN